jgi:hypothetical protein
MSHQLDREDVMNKTLTFAIAAIAVAGMMPTPRVLASDHLDAPGTKADGAADIADLYTWTDSGKTNLILTVTPGATTSSQFSNAVQFVFHTRSMASYGASAGTDLLIMCTFDSATPQNISCWAGSEYVHGDASATAGISSASGKLTVFAGLRDDPFFFNLGGFHDAEADVEAAVAGGGVTEDAAGCPNNLSAGTVLALDKDLAGSNHGAGAAVDFFAPATGGYSGNVLAIALQIDTTILTAGGPVVSVWASTNH